MCRNFSLTDNVGAFSNLSTHHFLSSLEDFLAFLKNEAGLD